MADLERDLWAAAAPGVVQTIASAFDRARSEPAKAGRVLSSVQRDLRVLNARRRRMVVDGLYDLVRHERLLTELVGTDAAEALWFGWLVTAGMDPDKLADRVPAATLERCARWELATEGAWRDHGALQGLMRVGSLPEVVARGVLSAFGATGARDFVQASNQRGPVTLRTNRLRGHREELIAKLQRADVPCHPGRWAPDAVVLDAGVNLPALPLYTQGWCEVQDEGSQLLAELVDARGLVVDLCAGAGGKTLALAAKADRVVAADIRDRALTELHKRATRAGARVEVHRLGDDGSLPKALTRLRADRVLVDAPCSGTGVLRRHPEHRWLVDEARLDQLVALQGAILDRAATLVKPGGRLVYGTCSVLPAENEGTVRAFLSRWPEFVEVSARSILGPDHGDRLQMAPHTHGTDGFFGAVFERR